MLILRSKQLYMTDSTEKRNAFDLNLYHSLVRIEAQILDFNWVEPFNSNHHGSGIGTGFFINKNGYILTCAHVVLQSIKIWVSIPAFGKDKVEAEIISVYPEKDIALLRIVDKSSKLIKHGKIPHLELDDSDKLLFGKQVNAVGYPLGQDKLKITTGIISGYQDGLIQTDAPLNSGNSGGPLLLDGKVIGINSAAYKNESVDNVGLAIPINEYKIVQDIMLEKKEKIIYKPHLGIKFHNIEENMLKHHNNSKECNSGIYVQKIFKTSPLNKINIKEGDIICRINDFDIDNHGETNVKWNYEKIAISEVLNRLAPYKQVNITYWSVKNQRFRKEKTTLYPTNKLVKIMPLIPFLHKIDYVVFAGLIFMNLALNHASSIEELEKYREIKNRFEDKLIVTNILTGSYAKKIDIIQQGDIITEVNGSKVSNIKELNKALCKPILKNGGKFISIKTESNKMFINSLDNILEEERFLADNFGYKLSNVHHKYNIKVSTHKNNNMQLLENDNGDNGDSGDNGDENENKDVDGKNVVINNLQLTKIHKNTVKVIKSEQKRKNSKNSKRSKRSKKNSRKSKKNKSKKFLSYRRSNRNKIANSIKSITLK